MKCLGDTMWNSFLSFFIVCPRYLWREWNSNKTSVIWALSIEKHPIAAMILELRYVTVQCSVFWTYNSTFFLTGNEYFWDPGRFTKSLRNSFRSLFSAGVSRFNAGVLGGWMWSLLNAGVSWFMIYLWWFGGLAAITFWCRCVTI